MPRKLSADERILWDKVVATVRPLHERATDAPVEERAPADVLEKKVPKAARPVSTPARAAPAQKSTPGTTLDAGWDRRLSKGLVAPDMIVDLHGHNLSTAYSLLDVRLEQAVETGARVLLLVTGKPPTGERWPVARGAIRAAVGDWLHASRHAASIAAVRGAHPRHGGQGALYIVLRRRR